MPEIGNPQPLLGKSGNNALKELAGEDRLLVVKSLMSVFLAVRKNLA